MPDGEIDGGRAEIRILCDRPIRDALTLWKNDGANPEEGVVVIGPDGEPVADLFFAPVEFARQLDAARDVQRRLLPRAVPKIPGFQFAGRYIPAGEVSGDYWSVKLYPEVNVVTCKLADVTGHGMAAAILMAAVKFLSGVLFRYSESPALVMERTNHSLLRETAPEKMATMAYAWIYPDSKRVRLVNAGHAPAFWCRADGTIEDVPATGPLLGLMETGYDEIEDAFGTGDVLCFCSDGVAEVGEPPRFGDDHLKETVRAHRKEPADRIADVLLDTARKAGPIRDDMTVLVICAT